MKILTLAALSGMLLATAGCVVIDADSHEDWDASFSSGAERLYSADISNNEISVRVAASGCTTKDFFDVDVDHEGGNRFEIELDRERRDYCEMLQQDGERLTWTFSELGIPNGAKVILRNPVGR